MKIKKVVIPAAGLGTRFLPITKAIPKEMIPIIDKPTLQFILEEAAASGIEEAIFIISDAKPEIEKYFTRDIKLEELLIKNNKQAQAELIKEIGSLIKVTFVTQKEQIGLGNAILCAKEAVNGEDFAIILGDDLVVSKTPCIKQLIDVYEKYDANIIGVQEVEHSQVKNYGIASIENKELEKDVYDLKVMVEKPTIEEAPSDFAVLGRYVLKNEIFNCLENIKPNKGEYQLTDGVNLLLENTKGLAYVFEGKRYDIGKKDGYVKAIIDMALINDEIGDEIKEYIKNK